MRVIVCVEDEDEEGIGEGRVVLKVCGVEVLKVGEWFNGWRSASSTLFSATGWVSHRPKKERERERVR